MKVSRTQPFIFTLQDCCRKIDVKTTRKPPNVLPSLSPKQPLTPPIPSPAVPYQSSPVSTRLDARAASLRAVHALCLSCWPRVHAHASKLLCALLWTSGDCARRDFVRKSCSPTDRDRGGGGGEAAGLPLGVVLAANHAAIDASADEAVREHATRLGALVLLLAGDGDSSGGGGSGGDGGDGGGSIRPSARATLREICSAVSALQPAGAAMEQLADRALLLEACGDVNGGRQSEDE